MKGLGNKIVVIGVSASGKSTFARKLAKKTGLPLILVDEIMWKPGWNYIGDEKTTEQLRDASNTEKWIIEGYIVKDVRTFLFEKADTIIFLDYPSITSSFRYILRWWKHRKIPRPELQGSPEEFSFKFLRLIWTKGEVKSLERFLNKIKSQKILRLKSPQEALFILKQ